MKKIISPVKGTRDFYPEQMAVRTWLYNTLRKVSESFGYQEYEAPLLESLDLYAAKSGEELVKEQAYVFTDRGGDQIALRPELTPSLARMIAQRQNELVFPVRWWSFGPFWRYERPQKGRTREFFQWNVDMLGSESPEADAELVAVLATFFRTVGLTPSAVLILVNDRCLMDAELTALGISAEKKPAALNWIDRRGKLSTEDWKAYGAEIGLNGEQIAALRAVLGDFDLWRKSESLTRFFAAVKVLGVDEYVRYDPKIVRGLQYYTGTVFEAWEVGREVRRSILGGGRYDNLLAEVGGERLPATGFAMGDVVVALLLEKYGLLPKDFAASPAPVLVTVFDQERMIDSLALAAELRRAGLNVVCYPEAAKLPRQFKFADRMGARVVAVIGPDEAAAGKVTLKDLARGMQVSVAREKAAGAIRQALAKHPAS